MKRLRNINIFFSVLIPEECLLIVQYEFYLKSINNCLICVVLGSVFIDSLMVLCNETLKVFTDFVFYGTCVISGF